jgi:hypothetical protein
MVTFYRRVVTFYMGPVPKYAMLHARRTTAAFFFVILPAYGRLFVAWYEATAKEYPIISEVYPNLQE